MNDFDAQLQKLKAVGERCSREFADLSPDLMDTKPAPDRWSINECIDHLIQSNATYHAILDDIAAGTWRGNFWTRMPWLPRLFGPLLIRGSSPETRKKKVKTFSVFSPSQSRFGRNLTQDLLTANLALTQRWEKLRGKPLNEIILSSPAAAFVTYSLSDCLALLAAHEERHLDQALEVKAGLTATAMH